MSHQSELEVSRVLQLLKPRSEMAYPIPESEWNYIKRSIKRISDKANVYHTLGSIAIGASISAVASIFAAGISAYMGWPIVIATFIVGVVSMYFGNEQRKLTATSAKDVLAQMELFEAQFKGPETGIDCAGFAPRPGSSV